MKDSLLQSLPLAQDSAPGFSKPLPPASNPVAHSAFGHDLCQGLRLPEKTIEPKYFYDAAGSALFDQICETSEYYPTRTELDILRRHAADIAQVMGEESDIIEFGAGSLLKICTLLEGFTQLPRYVPVDISGVHLENAAARLQQRFPALEILPLVADYTQTLQLPPLAQGARQRAGFFPGSTLGNFHPAEALAFLKKAARLLRGGGLLIGLDLVKSPQVLHAAYNDAAGVTAAFNRNVLSRANRELGADFNVQDFEHYAFYHPLMQRIEMHLVSTCRQTVAIGSESFDFETGESIHTESSYKFTIPAFQRVAQTAGFEPGPVWTDPDKLFCLQWLFSPA